MKLVVVVVLESIWGRDGRGLDFFFLLVFG